MVLNDGRCCNHQGMGGEPALAAGMALGCSNLLDDKAVNSFLQGCKPLVRAYKNQTLPLPNLKYPA